MVIPGAPFPVPPEPEEPPDEPPDEPPVEPPLDELDELPVVPLLEPPVELPFEPLFDDELFEPLFDECDEPPLPVPLLEFPLCELSVDEGVCCSFFLSVFVFDELSVVVFDLLSVLLSEPLLT